jgi:hypothetical protein
MVWPQKVGTSLFEYIQKAQGDEKKFKNFLDSYVKELVDFLKSTSRTYATARMQQK